MNKLAFKDLKNRVWISATLSALALLITYYSNIPYVRVLLACILGAATLIGLQEWMVLMKKKRLNAQPKLLMGFAVVWILSTLLSVFGYKMLAFNCLIAAALFLTTCMSNFRHVNQSMSMVSVNLFGVLYVVLPLSLILYISYPQSIGFNEDGRVWLAYLLAVTKITDVGGYFIGKMFGKHKLAPHLSPKKTLEGALGGLSLAIITSLLFYAGQYVLPSVDFSLTLMQAIVLGFLLGFLGQLGDLTESLFKRDANIKDSNAIPGIGGVLDMFDSLIFTAPTLFLFMLIS